MPCMNFTSAGVDCTFDRSRACSAPTTRLASPGAPGCTIGGPDTRLWNRRTPMGGWTL